MKTIKFLFFLTFFTGLILAADYLAQGKSIHTQDYNAKNPASPAMLSIINPKALSAKLQKGQKIYIKWCSACHGVAMPATNALAVLYKDTDIPALLEERTDLSPELVASFVRYGKHSMPFFRKTEINDEELALLSEYLSKAYKYK